MLVSVLNEILVEPDEGVVHHWRVSSAVDDLVHGDVKSIVDMEGPVSCVTGILIVNSVSPVRATETLLRAVLMDAPQVIYSVIDGLLVAVFAEEGRRDREESDILQLQFENGCIK